MTGPLDALQFPCAFPVKVMGRNSEAFERAVREIVASHAPMQDVTYASRPSSAGSYLSITATFTVRSRGQLEALYRELSRHELVLMTL